VPYQWRRVATAAFAAIALATAGKLVDVGLPGAVALSVLYPVALALLGFTSREERRRLGRLVAR